MRIASSTCHGPADQEAQQNTPFAPTGRANLHLLPDLDLRLAGGFFMQRFTAPANRPGLRKNLSRYGRKIIGWRVCPARPHGIYRDAGLNSGVWHQHNQPTTGLIGGAAQSGLRYQNSLVNRPMAPVTAGCGFYPINHSSTVS